MESRVYFIADCSDHVKIGFSTDVDKRYRQLQSGHPEALTLLGTIPGGRNVESSLHAKFSAHRLRGEWYKLTPIHQCVSNVLICGHVGLSSNSREISYGEAQRIKQDHRRIELLQKYGGFKPATFSIAEAVAAARFMACSISKPVVQEQREFLRELRKRGLRFR